MKAPRRASLVALAALFVCVTAGCGQPVPEPTPERRPAAPKEPEKPEPPDMIKEDVVVGTGAEAKDGDKVKVNYTGRLLKTNFMFDTSVGKQPFQFTLGKGEVIKGWDEGVVGMKVGGKRKLTIPSRLAYGDSGQPPKIPGKATLVFDVELVEITSPAKAGDEKSKDAKDKGEKAAGDKAKK